MELPLVVLQAPNREWLNKTQMSRWLGVPQSELPLLIALKAIVKPGLRPGYKGDYWTREQAAIGKWNVIHRNLYSADPTRKEG